MRGKHLQASLESPCSMYRTECLSPSRMLNTMSEQMGSCISTRTYANIVVRRPCSCEQCTNAWHEMSCHYRHTYTRLKRTLCSRQVQHSAAQALQTQINKAQVPTHTDCSQHIRVDQDEQRMRPSVFACVPLLFSPFMYVFMQTLISFMLMQ
jgi:hypothetical protein